MQPKHDYHTQGGASGGDLDTLARSSVVAAFEVDAAARLSGCNQRFCTLVGAPSPDALKGRSIDELLATPADSKVFRRARRKNGLQSVELRMKGKDGAQPVLCGDLIPGAAEGTLVGVFVDATEVFKLRNTMQRSARLEALGSLTSGVAHDFNNLLTVLIGNLALAAESMRSRPDDFAKLKSARDAATRGADLIQQLLAFARDESIESELVNAARVVRNLIPLVDRALGSRIQLEARLNEHVGSFRGNVAQLESVIVNLAVNARDAMPNGGKVAIAVSERELDHEEASRCRLSAAGTYVLVEVADTGSGIEPETLAKVFEPFFSTKGDRGSGLGLAMVRNFAEQCGGTAFIESAVGRGTTVTLAFPRCEETLDETSAKTMPLSTLPAGKESVLIVAGEESMRSTIAQILSVLGYSVRAAKDIREAAESLREQMSDLLIVDCVDPENLLAAMAKAARAAGRPALRVVELQSSGDSDAASRVSGARVLFKPFSLADLAGAVRATLDTPRSG